MRHAQQRGNTAFVGFCWNAVLFSAKKILAFQHNSRLQPLPPVPRLHHASSQNLGPDLGPVLGQTWVRPRPIGFCTLTTGGPAF
jgi:hypothetical protein